MLPIALLLLFTAVTAGSFALMARQPGLAPARRLGFGREAVDVSALPSVWFRLTFPLLNLMAPAFNGAWWAGYRRKVWLSLQRAGLGPTVTVNHLLAMKALSAAILPLLASQLMAAFTNPALFLLAGAGAFYLPDHLVSDLRKRRERAIVRALPGAVDMLSLSVEAGLEFLMAIQRYVERGRVGPLRDELATILNDIRLGMSRSEALKAFGARVDIPEVGSFVSVLVQADLLGASIGQVLKQQGERMRVERFQRAEKAGAHASQKILFPLVLFIFPAVLIVIVGPVILQFIYT